MSPSEIEDYLVFQKKIKRNKARQIIDKEYYKPASTPPRRDNLGDIRNLTRTQHKQKTTTCSRTTKINSNMNEMRKYLKIMEGISNDSTEAEELNSDDLMAMGNFIKNVLVPEVQKNAEVIDQHTELLKEC